MVANLHTCPEVLEFCRAIQSNAAQYTKSKSCFGGLGYFASQNIPPKTQICYYSGTLIPSRLRPHSNHRIDLGKHFNLQLVVDGTPEAAAPPALGSMQMVNHSCAANCTADHQDFGHGQLGVCFLTTIREIQVEEQITFDYKGDFGRPDPQHRGPALRSSLV